MLRGIAVSFVVFYHLNVFGFNNSGFLGVDVFFVISGYLMAMMYDPQKISGFYIKRAVRLLPAYFFIIILSVIIAIFRTAPSEYDQVSKQAIFASFFSSNIGFWIGQSYWENNSFRPLLHLWSLGVEIQFYLIVPVVNWLYKKNKLVVPIITILSLMLCFFTLSYSPKTAFFMLPYRLWQFLLGFIAAKYFYENKNYQSSLPSFIGVVSFVFILIIPFVTINVDSEDFLTGHPGLVALLISMATVTLLIAGIPKGLVNNPISDFLEILGNFSYSIYLVHFPIIAFYQYAPFSGTILKSETIGEFAWIFTLIVILSAFLFYFIEKPLRTNFYSIKIAALAPLITLVVFPLGSQIQKLLIPKKEMLVYQALFDRSEWRCGSLREIANPFAFDCELTPTVYDPDLRIFLIGDSHADSIKTTFNNVANLQNAKVYFIASNDPLYKNGATPSQLIRQAKLRDVNAIVLHYSVLAPLQPLALTELAKLASQYEMKLSFIMPVPFWDENIPEALIKNMKFGKELPFQTTDDYFSKSQSILNMVSVIDYAEFRVYPVVDVFCNPSCRMISEDGKPYYFDNGHLTLTGSELLRGLFSQLISDLE